MKSHAEAELAPNSLGLEEVRGKLGERSEAQGPSGRWYMPPAWFANRPQLLGGQCAMLESVSLYSWWLVRREVHTLALGVQHVVQSRMTI